MGLEEMYSNIGYLIVSDDYIEKVGYSHINSMEINAEDSFKVEDEIKQFYKGKNISEDDILIANLDESVKENKAIDRKSTRLNSSH